MRGMQGAGAPGERGGTPSGPARQASGRSAVEAFAPGEALPPGATRSLQIWPSGKQPSGDSSIGMVAGRNIQPDARWMARAFDGMNPGNPAAQTDAARALEAARQSREQAMRQGRGEGQGSGQSGEGQQAGAGSGASGMGRVGWASRAGGGGEFAVLPELDELRDANWAKLPPKLAQDLREAQANGVAGDYRVMVDAYFKALAEKARK